MVPNLDRMRALSELLADPQRTYPSIHITGTNGKTTTAVVATELLRALGLSVLAVIEERCRETGATLRRAGDDFALEGRRLALGGQALDLRIRARRYDEVLVPVFGERMADDALLGLAAVSAFTGDRDLDDD